MNKSSVSISVTFVLFFLFACSVPVSGFNITRLLNRFPEFGVFNGFLTKTRLFEQINIRQTITILALDNGVVPSITGNSLDVIKQILSAHVILDYYDSAKFRKLSTNKPTVLTTMFQATGDAVREQGFVKVVLNRRGQIEFGSAWKGAPFTSMFVRAVASQPYNISVIQISSPIVVPGIGRYNLPPPAPVAPEPDVAPVPAPTPLADTPSPADESPADAPSPDADSPVPTADAPDAPSSAPHPSADDEEDADAPSPDDEEDHSAASRGRVAGAGVMVAGLMSLYMAL